MDSLTDLVSIPSHSISVKELQDGIKNLLKEVRPEPSSGIPFRQKHQADPALPETTSEPIDNNPFHRTGKNGLTGQTSHHVTKTSAPNSAESKTARSHPAPNYLPTSPTNHATPQERPSEKWYRAQQARLSATSTTAVHNLSGSGAGAGPIDTASYVPIDPIQQFDEWSSYSLDPMATYATGYDTSSANHLGNHTQFDYTRYGWKPNSNNPFGP